MGFFAGLDDEKYDRQYTDRELTRRIVDFFKPQKTRLILTLILVVAYAALGAALPVIVALMVDGLANQPTLQAITLVSLAVLFIGIGLWGLNWARRSLVIRTVGDGVLDLRTSAFRAAAEHDLSFYDQFSSGRIVSRITSDTNDFGQLIIIITDVAAQIVQAVFLGVVLFRTDVKLTLLLLAFLPVIFLVASGFRVLARRVSKRGMKAMANVNATIKETISGISIAKNFRQEESIFKSFDELNQQSYQVNVQRGFVLSLVFPTLNALGRSLYRYPDLRRRDECRGRDRHRRRLVSLHHESGPVLLSCTQPVRLLCPDPVRPICRRAGFRPDRRRPECGPNRQPGCTASQRADPVRSCLFPLYR